MDSLGRQVALPRSVLKNPRSAAGIAALLLAGGSGVALFLHQAKLQQERKLLRRDKQEGGKEDAARGKGKGRKGSPKGPAALKKLMLFLLPLAGKRIVVMLVLAIARTALSNRLARVQGWMFRSAFLKRVPLFIRNLSENVLLCLVAAAVESTSKRVLETVVLDWRKSLTDRIHKLYFNNMTYYKMTYVDRRIDNPEQRICEDIPNLTSGLGDLLREWCNSCVDAIFYSWMLQSYSRTNKYTLLILGYVFGAGVLTTVASPNFGRLYKRQSENEGSYRQLQTRLRANAESVAAYGGIKREGGLIIDGFKKVTQHRTRLLRTQWLFSMWQDFNTKYMAATMAVILIIGPYFSGHLRPEATLLGRASMLSNMRYHTAVIISLFSACGSLASSSRKMMKLTAYAERLQQLEHVAKEISSGAPGTAAGSLAETATGRIETSDDEIAFEGAQVVTPANATLVKDLNLRVKAGTNLLVTGPNGSGKSSLFRILGGLWPLTKGVVRKPGGEEGGLAHEIFYVPQRPYVTIGTLQDQLIYPLTRSELKESEDISDERLKDLLAEVDLDYLVEREGGTEAVVDWGSQLSLGEQQRLGMARLFYHTPKFAILDECTSGVTIDMEERFCERVKQMGCTCVTISHRPALVAFHDLVLALDGEGGWAVHRGVGSGHAGGEDLLAGGVLASSNLRGGDAAACLQGMNDALAASKHGGSTPRHHGRILARAPEQEDQLVLTEEDWQPEVAAEALAVELSVRQRWRAILKVVLGRGTGAPKQIGVILVVVVFRTLLQDRIAALNGRTVKHLLNQDLSAFVKLVGLSVVQSLASAVLAPSLTLVADSLSLEWRKQLTKRVHHKYLKGTTFYSVSHLSGMQDVDARLTKDVERLSDGMSKLIPSMVKPVVDIAWFTAQLARLTGLRGMGILYSYALIGLIMLRLVTPDFGALARQEYFLEGAFRNLHSRLRTHAESIAFFGGGLREGSIVSANFHKLLTHLGSVIDIRWAHSVADDFLAKQLPHNVTWGLTMLYSLEHPGNFDDNKSQGILVNDMRYLASVVTTCFSSFGELLALQKRFAELSGGVIRVAEMIECVDKGDRLPAQLKRPLQIADSDSIDFKQVDVKTPKGKILARQLSMKVEAGHSLLVTGPNGSGKSSIIRVLGGLWPLTNGTATQPAASQNGRKGVFYVPQKPYTTVGTLRDQTMLDEMHSAVYTLNNNLEDLSYFDLQLIYPLSCDEAAAAEEGSSKETCLHKLDGKLDQLMGVVRLRYLLQRQGGWDSVAEWGDVLSLGEQQRVGMARLFFHQPLFGILDECTNATSVDVEEALYQHAQSLDITLVTITQRAALLKYHDAELRLLDGEGDWELKEIRHELPAEHKTTAEQ